MGLTKNQKVIIAVAIIAAIGSGVAAFLGGSAYNTMVEEKAIIELSFGNTKNYPQAELQFDGTNYFVEIVGINRGKSQVSTSVTVVADGANVSFNGVDWKNRQPHTLLIRPSEEAGFFRVYVQPYKDSNTFSLQLLVPFQVFIHDVFPVNPLNLEYQFSNGKYQLVKVF